MLQPSDLMAFVSVTDLDRGRDFYEQTLGLRVVEQNAYACVLDANGTMLRLTAAPKIATPG
jgi:catechol-2,3-dioxygenase